MDYVDDGSAHIIHASGADVGHHPAMFTLSNTASKRRYGQQDDESNNGTIHLSSRASPITGSPPSTSGGSSSDFGDYFMLEPDLQMSRANWWQDLVTIYHPNGEIGTKLVMDDILHLCVFPLFMAVVDGVADPILRLTL